MLLLKLVSVLGAVVALAVARIPQSCPIVPMSHGKIVGGALTTIEDLPYQISIQLLGSHQCGGSIISPTKVLTAAHCIADYTAKSLTVRAGSSCRGYNGTVVNVLSICSHPKYNSKTYDNDVSVLLLVSALPIISSIQPISLVDPRTSVITGFMATVSGWGTTSCFGSLSTQLQKLDVPKVSLQDCKDAYGESNITDSMTCYGYFAADTREGDSGGPLTIGRVQIGIVSWGSDCALPGKPGVYVDLSKAIIRNHINSC